MLIFFCCNFLALFKFENHENCEAVASGVIDGEFYFPRLYIAFGTMETVSCSPSEFATVLQRPCQQPLMGCVCPVYI
jgi:hypothetical protein